MVIIGTFVGTLTQNHWFLYAMENGLSYGFVLLSKFYSEDEIKEDKMGGACGTCGRENKFYSFLVGNLKERNHWED